MVPNSSGGKVEHTMKTIIAPEGQSLLRAIFNPLGGSVCRSLARRKGRACSTIEMYQRRATAALRIRLTARFTSLYNRRDGLLANQPGREDR